MVTYIQKSDLERIARRVWYAPRSKVSQMNDGEKHASFEVMGFASRSTEFPMRSGEWERVGKLEISISYPLWNIPGYIRVRKRLK